MFKEKIINILVKETSLKKEEIEKVIEIPPSLELGDYAFPCFILSKKYKKNPNEITQELQKKLSKKLPKEIEKIENKNAYLNFFINKKILAHEILKINANFGKSSLGKRKKIVIDFSAPNIGKPMHIGHIRSTIIGDSLMRIYDFLNYYPIGINYLGDIGLHIGKLIVAYELWLNKEELKKNPVNELLRLYVKFCAKEKSEITEGVDEEFQDNEWTNKAKEKIRALELGDKKTHKIWNDIRKSSEKGFKKIYELLKINFSEITGQSLFSVKGKQIVTNALLNKKAKTETDGAIYVDSLGIKKYILRSNQTASYITQDLGAAVSRYEKHKFEKMIYVTDYRQIDHFKHLFNVLRIFDYSWTNKLVHLPFGTINFGKEIMATRTGKIILLEEVLQKTINKADDEIKKRKTKGDPEKVGVGAIKYIVLKNEPIKDVNFSWEILNFEGNTGPYLQYAYARASSIIKKSEKQHLNKKNITIPELTSYEVSLITLISKFPEEVINAEKFMNPSTIANYAYSLAKSFNEFYHNCPVLNAENKDIEIFRLKLVDSFRTTLKNSLHLLGIEVMEEM